MVAANIKVFLRVRPSAKPARGVVVKPEEGTVVFELDKASPDGQVNNSRTSHTFKFDGILPMQITQEQVFDVVAKPVIDDVINGINGTIFAYGQTGSGKTFTITGGTERFDDRGLIPRTIAYMFESFRRGDAQYRMYISYLEIYNNDGYDLLSRDDCTQRLEDLPKVQLREDEDGNTKLRNLSINVAEKVEDALNLLFLGDTNRQVAETPMNDASTRSHCMFILWVDSSHRESDTVRRAKLHLVDLAGSERIGKTGVGGKLQKEATHINLSLHHLETVIVALHERSLGHRTHVPYRNSTMTQVLRDSLGGNCKTVMVGTAASEDDNVDESISTCRFAQRVAQIKNNASVNEELDPALLIKRLKREVGELKDELKLIQNEGASDDEQLSAEDIEQCKRLVSSYLEEPDPMAPFVCGSASCFRECFNIMREVYWHRQRDGGPELALASEATAASGGNAAATRAALLPGSLEFTVQELREQVAHRDHEIQILLNSLGKRSRAREARPGADDARVFIRASASPAPGASASHLAAAPGPRSSPLDGTVPPAFRPTPDSATDQQPTAPPPEPGTWATKALLAAPQGLGHASSTAGEMAPPAEVAPVHAVATAAAAAASDATTLLVDRNKAFEVFRKSHRRCEIQEENQRAMAALVAEAKTLGECANAARHAVIGCKSKVERLRTGRNMENAPCHQTEVRAADGPEITALLSEMEEQKRVYQQSTQRLTELRAQIEEYQRSAAQNKQRLQRDFEAWLRSYQASHGLVVHEEDSPSPEPSHRDALMTVTSVSSGGSGNVPSSSAAGLLAIGSAAGTLEQEAQGTGSHGGSAKGRTGPTLLHAGRQAFQAETTPVHNESTTSHLVRQTFHSPPSPAPNGYDSPSAKRSHGGGLSERMLRRPNSRSSLVSSSAQIAPAGSPSLPPPQAAATASAATAPTSLHAAMPSPAGTGTVAPRVPTPTQAAPRTLPPMPTPAPAALAPPASALTGDADVDDDIAAYYAAIAELSR